MMGRAAGHSGVKSGKIRKAASIVVAVAAVSLLGWGAAKIIRSPLFTVKVVEVADLPGDAPVDAYSISILADVPTGKENLFSLDLAPVEKRILTHPWVKSVDIKKRFPQTVSISVGLKRPRALVQQKDGTLAYVDVDGSIFGEAGLRSFVDLPLLVGQYNDQAERMAALGLYDAWQNVAVNGKTEISSVFYDQEKGYRLFVSYPLMRFGKIDTNESGKTTIELGFIAQRDLVAHLAKIGSVLKYLSENNIVARQIFADLGKKIVVKITRGS